MTPPPRPCVRGKDAMKRFQESMQHGAWLTYSVSKFLALIFVVMLIQDK